MKRFIAPLLLLVVLAGGGGLYVTQRGPSYPAYTPLGPGDLYVGLGNSLGAGWNAQVGQGFADRLAARLQTTQPTLKLHNFAIPGETTSSFGTGQLPRALRFIAEQRAAGRRVSPITISIGGNDARNAERRPAAERQQVMARVQQNLASELDQLLAATTGPNGERTADIVVMNYYNPWGGDPANTASPAYWANQLNQAIANAAGPRKVPVADVFTPFEGGKAYVWTFIATGDIHANNQGHQVIADQFWQALQYK